MGFGWQRVGGFESTRDANYWCNKEGIDLRDSDVRQTDNGVELYVRSEAMNGKENDSRKNGFF